MKKLIFVVMMVVIMTGQLWAATDCKQLTAKYIKAAQQDDFETLVRLSEPYQHDSRVINKTYPRYKVESAISELYEREKVYVVKWMFTPSSRWKILEIKKTKVPSINGKYVNGCIVYVKSEYEDNDDAPSYPYSPGVYISNARKLKSVVTILPFNLNYESLLYPMIKVDDAVNQYWQPPNRKAIPVKVGQEGIE